MQSFAAALIHNRNAAKVKPYFEGSSLTKKGVSVFSGQKGAQPFNHPHLCLLLWSQLLLQLGVVLVLAHTASPLLTQIPVASSTHTPRCQRWHAQRYPSDGFYTPAQVVPNF